MKTINLILLFSVCSLNLSAQNIQNYVGIYKTDRECVIKYSDGREDETVSVDYWPISTEYLEITWLDNQEQLGLRFVKTTDILPLNMINDTEFTFSQLMTYPFNNPYLIEGSGSFNNNKLKLDYTFTGGDIGICDVDFCTKVECSSEGIKTNDTKNPQQFLGEYQLEGTCNVLSPWQGELPREGTITITAGTESDLLISNIGFASSDFKAFILNDSLFIPSQVGNIVWEQPETFQGKGKIRNNSLFISFTNGGEFGFGECECQGERIIYSGQLISIANPCTTSPCLPGTVFALEMNGQQLVLSKNSQWFISQLIIDNVEYAVGDRVSITGYSSLKQDINSNEYLELEILSIEKNTTAVKETTKTAVNIYTTNNTLTIESPEEQITAVSLFDITGKKIIDNQNLQTNLFQYPTENTGIIICSVTLQSGKQITQKIISK